jgi:hypothetical protein
MTTDPNSASTDETLDDSDPQGETPNNATEPSETQGTTEPTTQQTSLNDDRKEMERLKASLKRANAEAKTSREQAAELAKFKEQTEAATLSEQQKQLADYQSRESEATRLLQEERNTRALERAGRGAGIADPVALDDAIGIALKSADLEHDEQGKPVNADEVMKQIVKSRPWFLPQQERKAPPRLDATNPSRSTTTNTVPETLSWEYITKLQAEKGAFEALPKAQQQRITLWMTDYRNNYRRF